MKRRGDGGHFNNIVKELRVEDLTGFDIFRMDVAHFEYILTQISDLISPKHRHGGTGPIGLCLKIDFFAFFIVKKKHTNVRNMLQCICFAPSSVLKEK